MTRSWIVVANSARARIFSAKGMQAPLNPVLTLINEEARLHDRDLASDRAGQAGGHHAMGQSESPKAHALHGFAKLVAGCLEDGRKDGQYEQVSIIAAPEFLGLLRKEMSDASAKLILETVAKDVVDADEGTFRSYLTAYAK